MLCAVALMPSTNLLTVVFVKNGSCHYVYIPSASPSSFICTSSWMLSDIVAAVNLAKMAEITMDGAKVKCSRVCKMLSHTKHQISYIIKHIGLRSNNFTTDKQTLQNTRTQQPHYLCYIICKQWTHLAKFAMFNNNPEKN